MLEPKTRKRVLLALGSIVLSLSGTVANTPPVVFGGRQFQLNEDTSFNGAQLLVYDADGDTLVYALDTSQPAPCGNITFSGFGYFSYSAGKDCTGVDEVPVNITEQRTNGSSIYTTIEINVLPVNDAPHAAWLQLGANLTALPSLIEQLTELTISEIPSSGWEVGQVSLTLLAWDIDEADSLQLIVDSLPLNGTLRTRCFSPPPSSQVDCSAVNSTGNSTNSTDLDLGLVCGLPWRRVPWNNTWIACELTYFAQPGFYGVENITVLLEDSHNETTAQLYAEFFVLEYLCQHDSNCTGNFSDGDCRSSNRSVGFSENYFCSCHPGYAGRFCEVDINECEKAQCAWNETCIDLVNAYRCECPSNWPCSWLIPLAVGGGVSLLAACLLICVPLCLIHRLRRRRASTAAKEDKLMILRNMRESGRSPFVPPQQFLLREDQSIDDEFGSSASIQNNSYIASPKKLPRMQLSEETVKAIFVRRHPFGVAQQPPSSVRPFAR